MLPKSVIYRGVRYVLADTQQPPRTPREPAPPKTSKEPQIVAPGIKKSLIDKINILLEGATAVYRANNKYTQDPEIKANIRMLLNNAITIAKAVDENKELVVLDFGEDQEYPVEYPIVSAYEILARELRMRQRMVDTLMKPIDKLQAKRPLPKHLPDQPEVPEIQRPFGMQQTEGTEDSIFEVK